jgi:hypothetical protein
LLTRFKQAKTTVILLNGSLTFYSAVRALWSAVKVTVRAEVEAAEVEAGLREDIQTFLLVHLL